MVDSVHTVLDELFQVYEFTETVSLLASHMAFMRDNLRKLQDPQDDDDVDYGIDRIATPIFQVYIRLLSYQLQSSKLKLSEFNVGLITTLKSGEFFADISRYCPISDPKTERTIAQALYAAIKKQLKSGITSIRVGDVITHENPYEKLDDPKVDSLSFESVNFLEMQIIENKLNQDERTKAVPLAIANTKPKVMICANIRSLYSVEYNHFVDILRYLTENDQCRNYEFIAVIYCNKSEVIKEGIEDITSNLQLAKVYIAVRELDTLYLLDQEFRALAKQVRQVLVFSKVDVPFPNLEDHLKLCGDGGPVQVKTIVGHEQMPDPKAQSKNKTVVYSMGLSESAYGIKLRDLPRMQPQDVLASVSREAPAFVGSILEATHSTPENFFRQHLLVPAHFGPAEYFFKYCYFLMGNKTLPADRSIVIGVFGNANSGLGGELEDFEDLVEVIRQDKTLPYSKIVLINSKGKETTLPLHERPGKSLYIMYDFDLNINLFAQLCQGSELPVGVSDEIYLEIALSAKALPYYGNQLMQQSIKNLNRFVKRFVGEQAAKKVFADILTFLDPKKFENFKYNHLSAEPEIIKLFSSMDLIAMTQAWQKIAKHIFEKLNFYNNLLPIFFHNLSMSAVVVAQESQARESQAPETSIPKTNGVAYKGESQLYSQAVESQTPGTSHKGESQLYLESMKRRIEATDFEVGPQLFAPKLVIAPGLEKKVPKSIMKLYDIITTVEKKNDKTDADWDAARKEFNELALEEASKSSWFRSAKTKAFLEDFFVISAPTLKR